MAVNRGGSDRGPEEQGPESLGRVQRPAVASGPDPFLGHSAALTDFLARLRRAAASDSTVLLMGESGTGKSRAAERLHAWSPRAAGPLVAVSLVATSGTLIDATLFGHERGAFTDAHRSRKGIFRRASSGTVVLDGVEHLPLATQVKLLRVLQERVVEPLGGEESIPVDVRVVATCGAPLEPAVQAGSFREDLYFRLAVLPLEVPPLRLRTEDIEALALELVASVSARVGVAARPLAPEAVTRLVAHPWRGNVRELENVIERVLVLGSGPQASEASIQPGELDFLAQATEGAAEDLARAALALGLSVEAVTHAMMARAVLEHRGNLSAAARSLGLTRRALEYRLSHAASESREEVG